METKAGDEREGLKEMVHHCVRSQARGNTSGNSHIRMMNKLGCWKENIAWMKSLQCSRMELTKRMTGWVQTAEQQTRWIRDTRGDEKERVRCILCGQRDSKIHRLLDCPMLEEIREANCPQEVGKWVKTEEEKNSMIDSKILEHFTKKKGKCTITWKVNGRERQMIDIKFHTLLQRYLDTIERDMLQEKGIEIIFQEFLEFLDMMIGKYESSKIGMAGIRLEQTRYQFLQKI